jgi:hypothetical protein
MIQYNTRYNTKYNDTGYILRFNNYDPDCKQVRASSQVATFFTFLAAVLVHMAKIKDVLGCSNCFPTVGEELNPIMP